MKSRKSIEQLFKEGISFSVFPFRVLYLIHKAEDESNPSPGLKAAFSVSKKYFKHATERNRVKRLMRESWRLQKNNLLQSIKEMNSNMMVFIIYTGNEIPEYQLVFEKTGAVLKRLYKNIK
ncbi:MAG: ribonuclease P protein component [Bacteroidetes bacterium]|nr:ribonuclease P protein component [Bacteroidota bacterium]